MGFSYAWSLKDGYPANGIKANGLKVFSTFSCGGGSTMGYKLAGYTVIGGNDIDPKMAKVYTHNHQPRHFFLCPINELLDKKLPEELYNLDILDGSPPCSTFSMAGSREKAWKTKKTFREGQAKQVLSDLFFDWIALVDRLKPKIAIAENVKGMLAGNAKAYAQAIIGKLNAIGYDVQVFLLNAASMGVPQRRERVFFIASKKILGFPKISLSFSEKPIRFKEFADYQGEPITSHKRPAWENRSPKDRDIADSKKRVGMKASDFNCVYIRDNAVPQTLTTKGEHGTVLASKPIMLSKTEMQKISTFPLDYDFLDQRPGYVMGMCVPPVMMAQLSHQIYKQWFSRN